MYTPKIEVSFRVKVFLLDRSYDCKVAEPDSRGGGQDRKSCDETDVFVLHIY